MAINGDKHKTSKQARIFSPFEDTCRKKFPDYKSMYDITKELNRLLEETLYGKKETKKRKQN